MSTPMSTRLLNRSVAIRRETYVPTGYGGSTVTLATVASVRCALRPASSREVLSAEQMETRFTHVLYLDAGVDVRRGDRFTFDGFEYRVVEVEDAAYRGHHLEVRCMREVD